MSLNREQPMRQFLNELADAFEAYEVPDGSIGTDALADGAVTTAKIANGAVDMDKLASDVLIPQPTDAQVTSAVNASLAAHPEWTTTVQPNSIGDDKLVQTGGILETVGAYDTGTTYDTLDATYNRVMAVYAIRDVDSTFCYRVLNKSTNGSLAIRVTDQPTPYNANILQSVVALNASDTQADGMFVIDAAVRQSAKYIIFMNATAGLEVSFDAELYTLESVSGILYETTNTADALYNATIDTYSDYAQGGFNGSTGEKVPSNSVVRTDTPIDSASIIAVKLAANSGLHVQLYSYDASDTFIGRNDLGSTGFSLTSKEVVAYRGAKYVTFGIYLDAGGTFDPAALAENGGFSAKTTNISTVAQMNEHTNTQFANLLKTVGKTPMATWVDDDGVIVGSGGGIDNIILPVANAVGIPVTFAVIPPLTDSVTVGGVTMTRGDYFKELQRQGHHIAAHPTHTYWYGNDYDLSKVNPSLIDCITEFQQAGLLHSDMLVYPGSSGVNADVVEIVRKWCVCGVLSGYGTPNHLGESTRWGIKRTFVNFEDYDSLHSSDAGYTSAMDWYKVQVDSAYANGDWIVFGTHSYQFTTSTDTSNPNANTLGNLQLLMQYVVDKDVEFRTLWDAYSRREYLFTFNEINA